MAAPVAVLFVNYSYRDAKGNTSRVRVLIGDATTAAIQTDSATLRGHLAAISNAVITNQTFEQFPSRTPGAAATYETVEDKAIMTFYDPAGMLHRYALCCPAAAIFLADGETVDNANVAVGNVITDFQTFVYGRYTDTAPLVFVGGVRARRKLHRRINIFTRNPQLSGPGL